MSSRYNPRTSEPKWQKAWNEKAVFRTLTGEQAADKSKYYVLEMFPYPDRKSVV